MSDEATVYQATRVIKPWGQERIFAYGEAGYVGKILTVHQGSSLSTQYHTEKTETICVISGAVSIEYGPDLNNLVETTLTCGDTIHIPAGVVHRVYGITQAVLVEASTAAPGWQEDVVRLEDFYGRAGTTAA